MWHNLLLAFPPLFVRTYVSNISSSAVYSWTMVRVGYFLVKKTATHYMIQFVTSSCFEYSNPLLANPTPLILVFHCRAPPWASSSGSARSSMSSEC